jgi:hypothetical protein
MALTSDDGSGLVTKDGGTNFFVSSRPTAQTLPQGPFSVYAQHNAHFNSIRRDICPRQAFICDLLLEIQKFLDLGDHLILMLDGNSNMKNSDLSKSLSQLSLSEAILGRHGNDGPATHKRNSTGTPIDGIWFSPGLEIQRGGYLEYDAMLQFDHRCLWVDLSFQNAFGHNMAPIHKKQARRLHCRDPRLVQNYIHLYHQLAHPLNLFQRVRDLEQRAPLMSKLEVIHEYETLDALRCEVTASADRRCRKLRTGQVAFSPELNANRMRIKVWLLLIAKLKNRKISSRLIKRSLKKRQYDNGG